MRNIQKHVNNEGNIYYISGCSFR